MTSNAYEIVRDLLIFINGLEGPGFNYRAVMSFRDADLGLPLTGTVLSIHCKENIITRLVDEETASEKDHHKTRIALICFAPYESDTVNITQVCEKALSKIYSDFSMQMKSYTVGDIEIDEDLRSFRVNCEMLFEFDTDV